MAVAKTGEKFAQFAFISLTESAANTLSSQKLETGVSVSDKVAWLISRIEYTMNDNQIIAAGDAMEFGLSAVAHGVLNDPLSTDQGVLDYNSLNIYLVGAGVNADVHSGRLIRDFSTLPGGGILTSAHSLYTWVRGTSLASALTIHTKIWYQTIQLANEEFWDLVQMHQPLRS